MVTASPANKGRKALPIEATLKPASLAASRLSSTATVGLLAFNDDSISTKPSILRIPSAISCEIRCNSLRSEPCTLSIIGFMPPDTDSLAAATEVILMPAI